MIGNNTLEYVASGIPSSTFNASYSLPYIDYMRYLLAIANKNPEHRFSFLFNAHMERSVGERMYEFYKDDLMNIYSDSGGLQIITQGLEISEEMKNKVYITQGSYSNCAMSFDEIPVVELQKTSLRMDHNSRFFDSNNYKEKARLSGINLNNQINKFKEMGSKCKPLMILQGNDYETFVKWTDILYNEVSDDNKSLIGGIAMGSPAIGFGVLEDIQKIFYYTEISKKYPELPKHLHILGVGSVSRLIPLISFMKNGLLKDTHISYDSSTISQAIIRGHVFLDKMTYIGSTRNPKWDLVYEEIKKEFPLFDITTEEFYNFLTTPYTGRLSKIYNLEKTNEIQTKSESTILSLSVINFIRLVTDTIHKEDVFLEQINPKMYNAITNLCKISSPKEYFEWERINSKYINSKKVKPLNSCIDILNFLN